MLAFIASGHAWCFCHAYRLRLLQQSCELHHPIGDPPVGDIADPRHPLRFHNVVSNLKRDKYPGDDSPLQEANPNQPDTEAQQSNLTPDESNPQQSQQEEGVPPATQQHQEAVSTDATQQTSPDQAHVQSGMRDTNHDAQGADAALQDEQPGSPDQEDVSQIVSEVLDDMNSEPFGVRPQDYRVSFTSMQAQLSQLPDDAPLKNCASTLQKWSENPQFEHLHQRITELQQRLGFIEKAVEQRKEQYGQAAGSRLELDPRPTSGTDEDLGAVGLNDLFAASPDRTLSKGGPVPAGQVFCHLPVILQSCCAHKLWYHIKP